MEAQASEFCTHQGFKVESHLLLFTTCPQNQNAQLGNLKIYTGATGPCDLLLVGILLDTHCTCRGYRCSLPLDSYTPGVGFSSRL